MSKKDVRKMLQGFDKQQLTELILSCYSNFKEVKECLDGMSNPNKQALLESYKAKICEEFIATPNNPEPRHRTSICKQLVRKFEQTKPDPALVADLKFYFIECASAYFCETSTNTIRLGEAINVFYDNTLMYIRNADLWEQFNSRALHCLSLYDNCQDILGEFLISIYNDHCHLHRFDMGEITEEELNQFHDFYHIPT